MQHIQHKTHLMIYRLIHKHSIWHPGTGIHNTYIITLNTTSNWVNKWIKLYLENYLHMGTNNDQMIEGTKTMTIVFHVSNKYHHIDPHQILTSISPRLVWIFCDGTVCTGPYDVCIASTREWFGSCFISKVQKTQLLHTWAVDIHTMH